MWNIFKSDLDCFILKTLQLNFSACSVFKKRFSSQKMAMLYVTQTYHTIVTLSNELNGEEFVGFDNIYFSFSIFLFVHIVCGPFLENATRREV